MGETVLFLGGMRSGKSRLAAEWAGERPPVTYVATATLDQGDAEMVARIRRHQAERPAGWATREVPIDLEGALADLVAGDGSVIIDCVTLWVTNLVLGLGGGPALSDGEVLDMVERGAHAARDRARVAWVSNEVGWSIVPVDPLARRFADLQGLANQRLAAACDRVHLCAAGLSVRLK
jgi:adenosylcobinamide kinase/adenosylcobinamide-phosphate guanylyltransferase